MVKINIDISESVCARLDEAAILRTDLALHYILTGLHSAVELYEYLEDMPGLRKAMKLKLEDIKALPSDEYEKLELLFASYSECCEVDGGGVADLMYPGCPLEEGEVLDDTDPEKVAAFREWYSVPLADFCEDLRVLGLTLFLRLRKERQEATSAKYDAARLTEYERIKAKRSLAIPK